MVKTIILSFYLCFQISNVKKFNWMIQVLIVNNSKHILNLAFWFHHKPISYFMELLRMNFENCTEVLEQPSWSLINFFFNPMSHFRVSSQSEQNILCSPLVSWWGYLIWSCRMHSCICNIEFVAYSISVQPQDTNQKKVMKVNHQFKIA